jgi:cell cycle checkpoint control protein RAD9A
MTTISLSLAPPAIVRLHDVLICLAKFSDTVAIEAEHDLVSISFGMEFEIISLII